MDAARPIPVVLDVDTGTDDALALILALRHPALDVRAVTCVAGNVSLEQVVANTLGVLALVDAPDIPVAAGMRTPLIAPAQDASDVHGSNGIADLVLPAHGRTAVPEHAVELLRRTIMDAPEPVTVIALAPLTNIAVLLRMHPEVAGSIARIVFMGGAIGTGNATAAAEFNVWHDPEAADIVVRSGIPVTMYGLEPFYRVTYEAAAIDLVRGGGSALHEFAGGLLAHLARICADEERVQGEGAAGIGDAGAVCTVIDPDAATVRRVPVAVSLAEGPTRGQTVVDLRTGAGSIASAPGPLVDVVVDVDADRYRDLVVGVLS